MKSIISDTDGITLHKWLMDYIGDDNAKGGCVSVVDLSLVPTEVIHVITAVIARMVFEALQRYIKLNNAGLPTVLVMEEAHTFIRRYRRDSENVDVETVCCQVFERVAREGRKFGLGLVLSSSVLLNFLQQSCLNVTRSFSIESATTETRNLSNVSCQIISGGSSANFLPCLPECNFARLGFRATCSGKDERSA